MERGKASRVVVTIIAAVALVYLLLLIPERSGRETAVQSAPAAKQAFAWNQDAYWKALEAKYQELRKSGCKETEAEVRVRMEGLQKLLARINAQELSYDAPEFGEFELLMFETGPFVGACGTNVPGQSARRVIHGGSRIPDLCILWHCIQPRLAGPSDTPRSNDPHSDHFRRGWICHEHHHGSGWAVVLCKALMAADQANRQAQEARAALDSKTKELEIANKLIAKQSQEALSQSESRTRALLSAIPDMIFEMDDKGIIIQFIPSSTINPLLPPEEFVGRNISQIMPLEVADQTMFAIRRTLESGLL